MNSMNFYLLISIRYITIILYKLMVRCTINVSLETQFSLRREIMAYSLLVKMGAAYVGAIALLTAVATVMN